MNECLILDILKETNGVLYDYLEVIRDPELYLDMEDSIIHEVRISDDTRLAKAQQLLARLDSRQLYSFVGEKGLAMNVARKIKDIKEEQVIEAYSSNDNCEDELQASDIVVRKFNINMGMKDLNPLERVSFYKESNGYYERIQKDPSEISMMMP